MPKPEGKTRSFRSVDQIDPAILEVFDYNNKELKLSKLPDQWITYSTPEFSAVCPFSGLPDIGTVSIEYIAARSVLELKSFKYYLLSYRDVGIYQEHATQKLYADLWSTLKPKRLIVTTIYNVRGGIDTTCTIDSEN